MDKPGDPKYDYLVYLHRPFEYYGAKNEYVLDRLKKINQGAVAGVDIWRVSCGRHVLSRHFLPGDRKQKDDPLVDES